MSSSNFFSLVYDIGYMSKHPEDCSNLINQTILYYKIQTVLSNDHVWKEYTWLAVFSKLLILISQLFNMPQLSSANYIALSSVFVF